MKNAVAIALMLLYFSANTELKEIARIQILFEHFGEHRADNSELSFFDFIALHYFSEEINDGDFQRDQELPFKGDHCESPVLFVAILTERCTNPIPLRGFTEKVIMPYASLFNSSLFQFTIWQPPRA
ncbi:MAG: hypothetical protein HOP08_01175 [Cyclobacteriaceae bacterium]|nr:hypothetical protein [Cyclobacteriaceae bacterium]